MIVPTSRARNTCDKGTHDADEEHNGGCVHEKCDSIM